jgi:polysaccharide export outer membrane protein
MTDKCGRKVRSAAARISACTHRGLVAFALVLSSANIAAARAQIVDPTVPSGSPLGSSPSTDNSTTLNSSGRDGNQAQNRPYDANQPIEISGRGQNVNPTESSNTPDRRVNNNTTLLDLQGQQIKPAADPNEFERFVENATGRRLKRFGADLIVPAARDFTVPASTTVPPDYALNAGDVVSISLTGSVESSADFVIDSDGRIFLPTIGQVMLAGVRYRDLRDRIAEAVGRRYRGYDVSVAVRKLRGIRVYVTGFANNPGGYTVNSLSTLVNAVLAAGGPSSGGSFRSIKLVRNGRIISDFDLYDLIRTGDSRKDELLQNGDIVRIEPVGQQIAITGSVNDEAIYEARRGETVADVLRYAGGFNALADNSRVILYRLESADTGGIQVSAAALATAPVVAGDIIQVLSEGSLVRPLERQAVLVRIDGEVSKPGNYYLRPGATMEEALAQAGGLTTRAYVFGAALQRQSVKLQQRASFDEAVSQLELSLAAAPLLSTDITQLGGQARLDAARAVVDRLRATQPTGRIVLPLAVDATALPGTLTLENNDTLYIPPRPITVGVFGAVFRPASFLLKEGNYRVRDYINEAGGTIRVADKGQIFVVRANGAVISKRGKALDQKVLPGDVIFVPVRTHGSVFWQRLHDISQFLFGTGLTAAAIVSLTR